MKFTDDTFYTFLITEGVIDLERRRSIERLATALGDDFIGSPEYKKFRYEFEFERNNAAFLEHIAEFDVPIQVKNILQVQLEAYIERTSVEPFVSIQEYPVILTNQWLENTKFIAKKAFKETGNEVYKIVAKWCKSKREQTNAQHGLDTNPTIPQPSPVSLSVNSSFESSNKLEEIGFDVYIGVKYRTRLVPFLMDLYTGKKPKSIAYMLYALTDLGLLDKTVLNSNQTRLHRSLTTTFGNIGSRSALHTAIANLDSANSAEEAQINYHKQQIDSFLTDN